MSKRLIATGLHSVTGQFLYQGGGGTTAQRKAVDSKYRAFAAVGLRFERG